MAQVRSFSGGISHVGSLAPSSRIRRPGLALCFAAAGALSFWVPDIAVHLQAGPSFDARHQWAITILMPATFFLAYLIARNFAIQRDFRWAGPAMLLGVWLTGGLFMNLAAMASGSGFAGASGIWRLVVIVLSVIPIVTYILASYEGSLLALLAVTLGALLFCGLRASWTLLRSAPSAPKMASEKAATPARSNVA